MGGHTGGGGLEAQSHDTSAYHPVLITACRALVAVSSDQRDNSLTPHTNELNLVADFDCEVGQNTPFCLSLTPSGMDSHFLRRSHWSLKSRNCDVTEAPASLRQTAASGRTLKLPFTIHVDSGRP